MTRFRFEPAIGILLLVLAHSGHSFETCGYAVYDPDTGICCNGTLHVMTYEYTCCCGNEILDASSEICCDGLVETRTRPDPEKCCKCADKRLDIAIVADNSEGIPDADLMELKEFVKDVIAALDVKSGDVRIAFMVYTHNVYIDFHLSDLSTVDEMLTAINNAPLRSGGTETGRALKAVHEQIFIVENGDRLDVPNILLLVTDGKSNTPTETTEQVGLLKSDGVFIVAIGVGTKIDEGELYNVATGAGNENVFNVTGFGALDAIKDQIHDAFFSCREFPSKPLCGGTPYDPSSELCCQGYANAIVGSTSSYSCCGMYAYHENTQKCCGGENIFDVTHDPREYGCCSIDVVFHIPSELCCGGNNIAVDDIPMFYQCCGDAAAYDVRSEVCCNSEVVVSVQGDPADYQCCGDAAAYDMRSEVCCNSEVVVSVHGDPAHYQCCGDAAAYDVKSEVCCNSAVVVAVQGDPADYQCCGDAAAYNVRSELCCNSDVVVAVQGDPADYKCCGDDGAFDSNIEICCLGNVVPIADGCCGDDEYFDPDVQICCTGIVQPRFGSGVDSTGCCNGTSFPVNCFECVNDELVSLLDETTHICCGSTVHELVYDNNCCCGDDLFDSTLKMCCDGQLIDRPTWDQSVCCECPGVRLDIAIVADHSESVEPHHAALITFVKHLIDESRVDEGKDQVALVVYTHEVFKLFDLNDYGTIADMKNTIDKHHYKTGGSSTELALDLVRDEIFVTGNGDRVDAPNVIVLVFDGKSVHPTETIAAAAALKATGVKIVAVGVGDTDVDELEAIASQPSDKYVFNVTNFDTLKDLQVPLTMMTDECMDDPVEPPYPKCNGVSYSDKYYICCDGVVQPRYGGKRAACCGDVSYDRKLYVCCEESLQPKVAGGDTECCCRQSFNPATHLCCGNDIRIRTAGEYTECCGTKKYDTRSQVCCMNTIQKSYGVDNTYCCNTTSYNYRCYTCDTNYDIVPIFNPNKKICCDGNIKPIKYGNESCCCGTKQFSLVGQLCCDGVIRDVPDVSTCACCGDRIYDVILQLCCDGNTRNKPHGDMTVCCGRKVMHAVNQLCCDGEVVDKTSVTDRACCNGLPYNPDTQICCKDTLLDLPMDPTQEARCCGRQLFEPVTQFCCGGLVRKRDSGKACCGHREVYNPSIDTCLDKEVVPIIPGSLSRCGRTTFNASEQTCCAGSVQEMGEPGYTKCCYDTAYDVRNSTCCYGNLYMSKPQAKSQCCLSRAYSPRRRICCNGRLVRKILPSATECCGRRRSYCPVSQMCCNGRVNARVSGETTQCCGKKSFDPTLYICCNQNVLLPRKYGESTACCEDNVYHPKYEYCCEDEVIPKDDVVKAG